MVEQKAESRIIKENNGKNPMRIEKDLSLCDKPTASKLTIKEEISRIEDYKTKEWKEFNVTKLVIIQDEAESRTIRKKREKKKDFPFHCLAISIYIHTHIYVCMHVYSNE